MSVEDKKLHVKTIDQEAGTSTLRFHETQDLYLALPARAMPSGPGKRKAACLTHEPGATSAPNQATSAARPASQKPASATAPTAGQAKTKQSTMQAFYAPMPVMASAASTAAPSATDPSPPPKLRSLYRCAVLAATDDAPNIQQILCDSTEGWIRRYHSNPEPASVEFADLTTRLAQKIDRQQAELAGNPPPPVPPTADGGGHDDAGAVDDKLDPEKAAFEVERGLRVLMVTLLEKVCSRARN